MKGKMGISAGARPHRGDGVNCPGNRLGQQTNLQICPNLPGPPAFFKKANKLQTCHIRLQTNNKQGGAEEKKVKIKNEK